MFRIQIIFICIYSVISAADVELKTIVWNSMEQLYGRLFQRQIHVKTK
jgi:hypothetical protein